MKKIAAASLLTMSLFAFTACNQAEDIQTEAESKVLDAQKQAEIFMEQAEEAKNEAERKLNDANEAAKAVKKLVE